MFPSLDADALTFEVESLEGLERRDLLGRFKIALVGCLVVVREFLVEDRVEVLVVDVQASHLNKLLMPRLESEGEFTGFRQRVLLWV